jgi:hypothetical protein
MLDAKEEKQQPSTKPIMSMKQRSAQTERIANNGSWRFSKADTKM